MAPICLMDFTPSTSRSTSPALGSGLVAMRKLSSASGTEDEDRVQRAELLQYPLAFLDASDTVEKQARSRKLEIDGPLGQRSPNELVRAFAPQIEVGEDFLYFEPCRICELSLRNVAELSEYFGERITRRHARLGDLHLVLTEFAFFDQDGGELILRIVRCGEKDLTVAKIDRFLEGCTTRA